VSEGKLFGIVWVPRRALTCPRASQCAPGHPDYAEKLAFWHAAL